MGAKESKTCCITYEEALKRVNKQEFKRLEDAFKQEVLKRSSPLNGSSAISKYSFIKEVLGDYVPPPIAECIFTACGGTTKGIGFKELICGLVLFTRGKFEEKCQFLFNIYSDENGTYVVKNELAKFLHEVEPSESINSFNTLFDSNDKVTYDEFFDWLVCNYEATSLTRWLLGRSCSVSLNNEFEMPTFYQTLAGVTHLDEADIIDLEKLYWGLKKNSRSGKLDLDTLLPLISPPLPLNICENFFNVFDENRDGHIDFKEMACGISAACRGPLTERQKFCFKIFDIDRDGGLSEEEILNMVDILMFVYHENSITKHIIDKEVIMEDIKCYKSGEFLMIEEYVIWTVHNNLSMDFLNLIFQVCHIVLGLRPISRQEENNIVEGWMQREERRGYNVGQFWYLVSYTWWDKWKKYVTAPNKPLMNSSGSFTAFDYKNEQNKTNSRTYSMPFLTSSSSSSSLSSQVNICYATQRGAPGRPGSIDNSNLVLPMANKVVSLTGEGGKLRSNLIRGQDYELVPDSLWKALLRWYGGSLPLARQVVEPNDGEIVELELYPLTLRILRHQQQPVQTRTTYTQPGSWSGMVGGYGAAALIGSSNYSYVSNTSTTPKRYIAYTATFSRVATIKNVYSFLCETLRLRSEDVRLWHYYNENNMIIIDDEDVTLELLGVCDDDQILLETRNKDQTWPEEIGSLANVTDKGKQVPTERGATGLNNLGNTCFMNAALQCVSNTQILTVYFTNNMHLYELNRTNVLGMKGHIAKRYGDLIHDIWSGTSRTVAPLKLRWTIGKYAPRFNGFQQHDSQELLAFLLDGLHEDLNRVYDKPYLELKDSEFRPDVIVAQEAWENHVLRNKSIIVDLFHGQLKSKVTCKKCGHESVKFDPFNYLSLPLPMESYVYVQVAVIRLNGSVPVKYSLRLNADDKYLNIKHQLMQHCCVPPYLLKLTEVSGSQIKTNFADEQKIKPTTNGSGIIFAYELPSPCSSTGSISVDEERLSISSVKSTHREAAQTFTAIQRSVRPGSQNNLHATGSTQNRTISEDSTDSAINSASSSSGGEVCCSENLECNAANDCNEILLDEMSGRLTVDSGHCSASSASLADSTDTNNSASQQPSYIIALHRKMVRQDVYFVSTQKSKPSLFGLPLIVPCNENTTHCELYQSVWMQVARFVSPLPPSEVTTLNHAMDCDDSLGYEFPFLLKGVNRDGTQCAWCPWYRFCRGCLIQCCDTEFCFSSSYIAIDWDPTALHLRYQTSHENKYECVGDDCKVPQSEPIELASCLDAFTTEEHLGDDEKYYCSKCQEHQFASKKLQIWRLPPILIIHLKRFQYVNGKWVKSQKVVKFPFKNFQLTDYLAAVPQETIDRYKELQHNKRSRLNKENDLDGEEDHDLNNTVNGVEELHVTDNDDKDEEFGFAYNNNNNNNNNKNSQLIAKLPMAAAAEYDRIMTPQKRKRLESTSLTRTPVDDSSLQDFHQHRLQDGVNPFDINYNLYAIVSHSGILGGGHYVSYASNPNGKWYHYNDSSCKEVTGEVDTNSAYMLFYERAGLSQDKYMPNVAGKRPVDINDFDDDFESDYKRMCHLM